MNNERASSARERLTVNFRLMLRESGERGSEREILHFPIRDGPITGVRRKCRSKFQPRVPVNATSKYVTAMRSPRGELMSGVCLRVHTVRGRRVDIHHRARTVPAGCSTRTFSVGLRRSLVKGVAYRTGVTGCSR